MFEDTEYRLQDKRVPMAVMGPDSLILARSGLTIIDYLTFSILNIITMKNYFSCIFQFYNIEFYDISLLIHIS